MALQPRIIPVLLLHKGGLYKNKQFKNPSYVGDPINAVRIFNEKEVDELLILDIDCSKEKKEPNCQILFQCLFCEKVLLTRETKSDTNLKTFITEAKIVFRVEN